MIDLRMLHREIPHQFQDRSIQPFRSHTSAVREDKVLIGIRNSQFTARLCLIHGKGGIEQRIAYPQKFFGTA